jgi:L-histidine Nalpha-methyltransferase
MTTTDLLSVEVYLTPDHMAATLAHDVRTGLGGHPRWIPAKWLYDQRGCELFQAITELPEYYPTRAERAVLAAHADDIADLAPATTLIELGSGTSEKTRLLIAALLGGGPSPGSLQRFVAVDVAEPTLRSALGDLGASYDSLELHGIVGDFERHLVHLPPGPGRMVAFLGGTIGNFDEANRHGFLATVAEVLEPGEWLLLGTDLVKDPARIMAAYDDSAGITAAFETNVLAVLGQSLGADFDLDRFAYVVRWNPDLERVEMGVRSIGAQRVTIPALRMELELADGEEISTEVSVKFRRAALSRELAAHGFDMVGWWTDTDGDFAVSCALRRASRSTTHNTRGVL